MPATMALGARLRGGFEAQVIRNGAPPGCDACRDKSDWPLQDQGHGRLMIVMSEAATYSARERLRNGRSIEVRALRPDDRTDMLTAVGRLSAQSLSRRFFMPKRELNPQEIAFFLNVDFVSHVALVAAIQDGSQQEIVGGGRYIVSQAGMAELAFVVVDQFQGQGIGAALLRHLASLARSARLERLIAEVLAENTAMLKVFDRSGLRVSKTRDADVVHVSLHLS
jgi:RimJ/RimL family protein N-acetyltransferase